MDSGGLTMLIIAIVITFLVLLFMNIGKSSEINSLTEDKSQKDDEIAALKKQLEAVRQELYVVKPKLDKALDDIGKLEAEKEQLLNDLVYPLKVFGYDNQKLFKYSLISALQEPQQIQKYKRAYFTNFQILNMAQLEELVFEIVSGDNTYHTSLRSCDCESFKFQTVEQKKPCKHMVHLALRLGFLSNSSELQEAYKRLADYICDWENKCGELTKEQTKLEHKINSLNGEFTRENNKLQYEISKRRSKLEHELEEEKGKFNLKLEEESKRLRQDMEKVISEQNQTHPGFARIMLYYSEQLDDYRLSRISTRGKKSAEIVTDIKHDKRRIQIERDMYFAQLAVYEDLFPWLEEFKELPISEAKEYVSNSDYTPSEQEYFRKWLSPEEFARLTPQERLQYSLDRWKNRKKSDWEVGIEYERYIGYLYEKDGYSVEYSGALKGLEDMGRDLVARKGKEVLIVQCKRWSKQKQIHEKHVFQLFGTGILYGIQNPGKKIVLVFATTASLSETAQACAEKLDIQVRYQDHGEYPIIKCNVNRTTGERIYHLPFDQQYDRVGIKPNTEETYAFTIEEAESLGFRHAFRYHG